MLADDTLGLKSSDETTDGDLRTLLDAPQEDEKPLVDAGVFEERQPERPIYKSIPLKAGVAAGVALVALLPVMGLFSGNFLSGSSTPKSTQAADSSVESDEAKAQREAATENADLKRKLALQSQAFTAEELDKAAAQPQGQNQAAQARATPQTTAGSSATAVPLTSTYPVSAVAPRTPTPVVAQRAPIAARPAIAPVQRAPIAPPAPTARFTQPPQEAVDLAAISEAGNYGQLPSRSIARTAEGQSTPVASLANSSPFASSGTIPVSVSHSSSAVPQIIEVSDRKSRQMPKVMEDRAPDQEADSVDSLTEEGLPIALEDSAAYEFEMNLIMGDLTADEAQVNTPLSLLPGSSALVEVTNALTWASDLPRAQGLITLSSPLISDGFEVLPAGTEMIVQIETLSESGAISLKPVAIVLPGDSEITAIDIPADAISILAVEGGYPVARAEDSSERQLRNIDRQQAMLGAMSGAGEFLTRPESETSVVGIGGSSFSRDYGSGSIFGSILSGAANQLLQSRSNRLEEEADQLADRPTIWSIEQGRQLQLFITQEIQL
jgi:hypothetical protein